MFDRVMNHRCLHVQVIVVMSALLAGCAGNLRYFDSATKTPSQSSGGGSASRARALRR